MARGVYIARNKATHSTAITILQLTAPSTASIEILRAWVSQQGSTTSAQPEITLLRKTATATVTSLTPVKTHPQDVAADSTAGHTASAEGTDGDILASDGFNVLNGWLYLPVPEERITVDPSGIIALKFVVAPASQSWHYGIIFREL